MGQIETVSLTYTMCEIVSGKHLYSTENLAQCSVMTSRVGMVNWVREAQEGGDICILIADSLCSTAELTQYLSSN